MNVKVLLSSKLVGNYLFFLVGFYGGLMPMPETTKIKRDLTTERSNYNRPNANISNKKKMTTQ